MENAAAAAPAGGSSSFGGVEKELHDVAGAIDKVEREISAVTEKIEAGEQAFETGKSFKGLGGEKLLSYLDNLRDEKKQLREKEKQLREKEKQLREEKAKMMDKQEPSRADDAIRQVRQDIQKVLDMLAGHDGASASSHDKPFSISRADKEVWGKVAKKANLVLKPYLGGVRANPRGGSIPHFVWGDKTEPSHAQQYLSYLKDCIGDNLIAGPRRRCVLLDGTSCSLDADDMHDEVGYKFHGKPDAVLVDVSAKSLPQVGLRVVFELKKNVGRFNAYQAILTVLLANWHSRGLKPFVILTDLQNNYSFYWLDGHTICFCNFEDALSAWGLFDEIFASEDVVPSAQCVEPNNSIEAEALPIAKRQRLVLGAPDARASDTDIANLADLEGFLSGDELRACHLAKLLQDLHAIPALEPARKEWEAMFA